MIVRHLFIDLSFLGSAPTGVALYALDLAQYLDDTMPCRVLCPDYFSGKFRMPVICPPPIRFKKSILFRHPRCMEILKSIDLEDTVFYLPHDRLLPYIRHQILTLHDTIPYHYPSRNPVEWAYYRTVLQRRIAGISCVLTVSESSRQAICARFSLPRNRVEVVPNGLDLTVWNPGPELEKHPFLLVVSANRPYKNTEELLDHHDLWSDRYRLKIVSSQARYGTRLRERIASLRLKDCVDFLDGLPERDLVDLYRSASACVYPSRMEGFGRPGLEASSTRCPLILSDIPPHRELFAPNAIFVQLGDRDSWASAFRQLANIGKISQLTSAGLEVSKKYTVENSRLKLMDVLSSRFPDLAIF